MESEHCPDYMALLSTIPTRYNGIQSITFGDSLAAGKLSVLTPNHFQGYTLGFLPGFTSVTFPHFAAEV